MGIPIPSYQPGPGEATVPQVPNNKNAEGVLSSLAREVTAVPRIQRPVSNHNIQKESTLNLDRPLTPDKQTAEDVPQKAQWVDPLIQAFMGTAISAADYFQRLSGGDNSSPESARIA